MQIERNITVGIAIYHFLGLLCCFSAGKKILVDFILNYIIKKDGILEKEQSYKTENIEQCVQVCSFK